MNLDHKNTHNKQEWMFNNYYNTSKNQHKVCYVKRKNKILPGKELGKIK